LNVRSDFVLGAVNLAIQSLQMCSPVMTAARWQKAHAIITSDPTPDVAREIASASQVTDLLRGRLYGHVMPTYKQAKLVAWEMLKFYAAPIPGIKTNEAELSVTYPGGARVALFGADNPDSLRGAAFSGLSFDEIQPAPAEHLRGGALQGAGHSSIPDCGIPRTWFSGRHL
jgi:hypothetical protein